MHKKLGPPPMRVRRRGKFAKRHYCALAGVIADARHHAKDTQASGMQTLAHIHASLVTLFANDNPNVSRDKFERACIDECGGLM